MKKFLTVIFGVLFAIPAMSAQDPCRNLTARTIDVTVTGNGTGYTINDTAITDVTFKANTRYTITLDVESHDIEYNAAGNLLWWSIQYTDNSFTYNGVTSGNYNQSRVSIVTDAGKTVKTIGGFSAHQRWTGGTIRVSNLQIEEGTTATDYVPHNPNCVNVDCENLVNRSDPNLVFNGYIPSVDVGNTTVITSGNADYTFIVPVQPSTTYTVKRYVDGNTAPFNRLRIMESATRPGVTNAGKVITNITDTTTETVTITTASTTNYLAVYGINGSASQENLDLWLNAFEVKRAGCGGCDGDLLSYESATGTVSRSGTPTPDNPIYPTFYRQGNMTLRKVRDAADSYDASTGKITRRVGVKVLTGNENWTLSTGASNNIKYFVASNILSSAPMSGGNASEAEFIYSSIVPFRSGIWYNQNTNNGVCVSNGVNALFSVVDNFSTVPLWKEYLQQQYAAGNPVTIWYPLATPTEETIGTTTYCDLGIKVATRKYNTSAFSAVATALESAVTNIKTVVANTLAQADAVAKLHAGKQKRPTDSCPQYRQCLLVEDEAGTPMWFVINDPFRDFATPIIGANLSPTGYTNPTDAYIQLEYLQSSGTQYIDTGVNWRYGYSLQMDFTSMSASGNYALFGACNGAAYNNGEVAVFWYDNRFDHVVPTSNSTSHNGTFEPYSENTRYTLTYDNTETRAVSASGVVTTRDHSGYYTGYVGSRSMILFGTKRNNISFGAIFKLHSMQIWDNNGVLIRDMVPVRSLFNGKYGMYDKVNNQFYANANTASGAVDFTPGPIVANDAGVPNISWVATWAAAPASNMSAGSANGTSRCNNLSASENALVTSANLANANWNTVGNSCWCKVSSITVDGVVTDVTNHNLWSFHKTDSACGSNCNQWCGYAVKNARTCREAIMNIN